ncbi:MAG: diaminopimelate epimerase, partial [Candidatus Omnitrophica bacterium]|nr:diaminopimelate epimerase [Candidatus Omnitrophota bacterium]
MSLVKFTKVVGAGNDFIVVDNRDGRLGKAVKDFARFSRQLCHRKYAIGADGVLVLERSRKADLTMRIFNPDGSEAGMCGNGARCSVLYARLNGVCRGNVRLETVAGIITASVRGDLVKLNMTDPAGIDLNKKISLGGRGLLCHFVD